MSRSNWLKVLQAAQFIPSDPDGLDGEPQSEVRTYQPTAWFCANALCRAMFMRLPFNSEYCPTCLAHLKEGRPDLLDPKVYAECQRVAAAEKLMPLEPTEQREWLERYHGKAGGERTNPRMLWRALIGLPPKEGDFDLDPKKDFKAVRKGNRGYKTRGHQEKGRCQ